MVAVLEVLGAGAEQWGGSSVGTAVEVEVDGAKKIIKLQFEERIFVIVWLRCYVIVTKKAGGNENGIENDNFRQARLR